MSSPASGDADRAGATVDRGDARGWLLGAEAGEVGGERVVGLARDVALETADDLGPCLRRSGASRRRAGAVAQPADGDQVECAVGVAVAAAVVETVAGGLARGRRDRAGAAERGERALASQAVDVLPGADEQLSRVAGRDAEQRGRARRRRCGPAARAARRARRSPRRGSGCAARASAARSGRTARGARARPWRAATGGRGSPCRGSSCARRAARAAAREQ